MNQNLSIIYVSYNTRDITLESLSLLKKSIDNTKNQLGNEIEVILVDNDSQDGSVEAVKKQYPWVKIIETHENKGYGAGNNIGMKAAKYPYILLLNTDAYVKENTLTDALTYMQSHPEIDVLGPKLIFKDHSFQPNAGFLPTPFATSVWLLGLEAIPGVKTIFPSVHKRNKPFYSSAQQVDWVMGAFFLLKREVFEKTHGFDEKIFMYMEEVEWCIRIKSAGFKVFYTSTFSLIHLGGASSGGNIAVPLFREMEGLVYVYKKHYPSLLWFLKLLIMLGCLMRIVAFTFLGKTDRVKAYVNVLRNVK